MNIAAPTETTQLVTIPKETALSIFTLENAMDPLLARIRKEVDAFVPDVTTAKGRKAIASMAYTVAQSKTYLDSVGKALADEQKEIPKKIDACRKKVRDTLDLWRDEVRQPLTDWETAEETRIKPPLPSRRQRKPKGAFCRKRQTRKPLMMPISAAARPTRFTDPRSTAPLLPPSSPAEFPRM